jgi:ribosomal protein S18 acetylase RimI-like enzyme
MSFTIRPYHASDLYSIYQICLKTGDSGADASLIYTDHELLGHLYAAPYAVFEPDLCFVLTQDSDICGYILGTRDSAAFAARCERDWFPVLRSRYPMPAPDDQSADAQIIRRIHMGHSAHAELAAYPAHLHVDLLPVAQGQGWGRQLMRRFLDQLRALGVPGVYLGVGIRNQKAIGFYERMGFERLAEQSTWIAFGMKL